MRRGMLVFLTAALVGTVSCPRPQRALDHEEVFTTQGLLVADAAGLASTDVTAHLEHPLGAGRNALWCATFQLVWNEFARRYRGELVGEGEPSVDILNRQAVKRDVIDEASCLLISGWVRDGILEEIPKALTERFGGLARPRLIPRRSDCREIDAVAYCYLFKNLEFAVPFERIRYPVPFRTAQLSAAHDRAGDWEERARITKAMPPVKCFGIDRNSIAPEAMRDQVRVLDYRTSGDRGGFPEEFIVELKTKSPGDRLILALVRPKTTLGETVKAVEERIARAKPVPMGPDGVLKVPKLNFDVTRDYKELKASVSGARRPDGSVAEFVLRVAIQNIRFQLDEKGARLRSEAVMVGGCAPCEPPPSHLLIFDRPFLLMLKRRGAKAPYLALWVDNAELLVQSGRR